jgi:hypothetical protein
MIGKRSLAVAAGLAMMAVLSLAGTGLASASALTWTPHALPGSQALHDDWQMAVSANPGKTGVVMFRGVPFLMPDSTPPPRVSPEVASRVPLVPLAAQDYLLEPYSYNAGEVYLNTDNDRYVLTGPPGDVLSWNNEGTTRCNGGTCFYVTDNRFGGCLESTVSGDAWILVNPGAFDCSPSISFELWSAAGSVSSPHVMYNLGTAGNEGTSHWGPIENDQRCGGNDVIYIQHNPSTFSCNGNAEGLWSLVSS